MVKQFLTIAMITLAIVCQSYDLIGQEINFEDLYTQATFDAQSINTGLS